MNEPNSVDAQIADKIEPVKQDVKPEQPINIEPEPTVIKPSEAPIDLLSKDQAPEKPPEIFKPFQTPGSQFKEPCAQPGQLGPVFPGPLAPQMEAAGVVQPDPRPRAPPQLEYMADKDYKKEYHKIYLANVTLMDSITQLMKKNSLIKKKISSSESDKPGELSSEDNSEEISIGKRRKKRRRKEEIERDFPCTFRGCLKSYG